MDFDPIEIRLKDGRTAILRAPKPEDAEGMLDYIRTACAETEYLLMSPDECAGMTVESEAAWLTDSLGDANCCMLVCEVDGEIAGNCEIRFNDRAKVRHRASIGIGLKQKYWNLGIGTAMFRLMEAEARRRPGVVHMELEFIEGNSRARALYEKMGFRVVGIHPDNIMLSTGLANEYFMQKKL